MNWFPRLVQLYMATERHYHTIDHPASMLQRYLKLVQKKKFECDHSVFLAIWWHDAVYNPMAEKGCNEEDSASLMMSSCPDESYQDLSDATLHIMATIEHQPKTPKAAILCDLDLYELSADWRIYLDNAAMVRQEFNHLDNDAWVRGRSDWLIGMLDRPQLFWSFAHTENLEAQARCNLESELGVLDSGGYPYKTERLQKV